MFYGDEAGLEGYRDPFCRKPFPWANINRELLRHYKRIGQIRKNNEVFREGLFRIIKLTSDAFIYVREPYTEGEEKILVAASRGGKISLKFPEEVRKLYGADEHVKEWTVSEMSVEYFACPRDMDIESIIK